MNPSSFSSASSSSSLTSSITEIHGDCIFGEGKVDFSLTLPKDFDSFVVVDSIENKLINLRKGSESVIKGNRKEEDLQKAGTKKDSSDVINANIVKTNDYSLSDSSTSSVSSADSNPFAVTSLTPAQIALKKRQYLF
jgi:hypothetical protein